MTPLRTGLPGLLAQLRLATPVTPVPWPSAPAQREEPPTFAEMLASVERRSQGGAEGDEGVHSAPSLRERRRPPGVGGLAFEAMSLAAAKLPATERNDAMPSLASPAGERS